MIHPLASCFPHFTLASLCRDILSLTRLSSSVYLTHSHAHRHTAGKAKILSFFFHFPSTKQKFFFFSLFAIPSRSLFPLPSSLSFQQTHSLVKTPPKTGRRGEEREKITKWGNPIKPLLTEKPRAPTLDATVTC